MGCTSSSRSAYIPSKHPIDDSHQRHGHPSTSTIMHVGENATKVTLPVPETIMVVMYPYSAQSTSLNKGDLVRLGDKGRGDSYWCEIKTNTDDSIHVPDHLLAARGSLSACEWYYECISKHEAEKKLTQPGIEPGTFLVHKKPYSDDYICTTMTECGTKQYIIRSEKGGYFITRRRVFISVQVLIDVFTLEEGEDIPFRLQKPLQRVSPIVYSCYEGNVYPLKIEIDKIEIGNCVGQSSVWEGSFNGNIVIVRKFNSTNFIQEEFPQSMVRNRNAYHKNLQLLIGFCCAKDEFLLVTENFSRGNLRDYLREECDRLVEPELINFCTQIASGMNCLELADITHGLLSARNIMISNDDLLKICDIGVFEFVPSKDYYVRWTAPEVLRDSNNTSPKTDVWSFGILLTEIVTLGEEPYSNLKNTEVETQVLEGYRMSRPTDCHAYLYDLMNECWNSNPRQRPTFDSLAYRLDDFYIAAEHETNPRQSLYRYMN